ncbi:hypothetical protein AB1K09_20310 [Solibacillus silvestris]
MHNKPVSDLVKEKASQVIKDERIVIHLDQLLAALDYNDTKTEQSIIPEVT